MGEGLCLNEVSVRRALSFACVSLHIVRASTFSDTESCVCIEDHFLCRGKSGLTAGRIGMLDLSSSCQVDEIESETPDWLCRRGVL